MNTNNLVHSIVGALALCTFTTAANAQGPSFGLKGGLNYATLYSDEVEDKNARLGFHVGVFGRTDAEQPIGLQVEALYSTRGATFNYDGFIIDQEFEMKTDYIDVPVMLSIRVAEVLEVQAGGYVGFLMNARVNTSGDLGNGQEELDRDNFTSMDYGVLIGVAVNAGPVQIGARYNLGLAELADSDAARLVLGDAKHAFGQVFIAFGLPSKD